MIHLEQVRAWFGRPLWDMEPPDAVEYFGKALRTTAKGTRLSRAQALKTYLGTALEQGHHLQAAAGAVGEDVHAAEEGHLPAPGGGIMRRLACSARADGGCCAERTCRLLRDTRWTR